MELNLKMVREKMRRCAHDNLPCTLTPEEVRAFFHDSAVYYECDCCGRLVRTPLQLRKELGDDWWGGHPSVLEEHAPDCKYTLKLKGACTGTIDAQGYIQHDGKVSCPIHEKDKIVQDLMKPTFVDTNPGKQRGG